MTNSKNFERIFPKTGVNTAKPSEPDKTERSPPPEAVEPDRDPDPCHEILYKGYYYDITRFVDKHPGGSVIKFYTEQGEDATQAIQQFHFRSPKNIELILSSFPRRVATDKDKELELCVKNAELSADFKQLFDTLVSQGYFQPSIVHLILRLLEPIIYLLIGLPIYFSCEWYSTKFLMTIYGGFTLSRFGWIMHEAGHGSLTGVKWIDRWLQNVTLCSILGGSAVWWNSQHNRHHAMPQRLHHDVDLAALPFVTFSSREVKNVSKYSGIFIKYQGFLYWSLDLFLVGIAWKLYIHPRCQIRKRAWTEMALNIPSHIFMLYIGPVWFFIGSYWFALFLALNFSLSHSHLDVADEPTHWIEYAFSHTANIQPSPWCDWWMGYLNYQIEHHLFPSMPQFRQRQVSHLIKSLADKHGLAYRVYSYRQACELAVKNLYHVGKCVANGDC